MRATSKDKKVNTLQLSKQLHYYSKIYALDALIQFTSTRCTNFIFFNPLKTKEIYQKATPITSAWAIVYIEGLKVLKIIVFLSLKIDFVIANSEDPDEMPRQSKHFILAFTVCQTIS